MKIKRLICIAVCALLCLFTGHKAHAQFLVNDPIHTALTGVNAATATADAFSNLMALIDQIELAGDQVEHLKEWKEKLSKWQEDIEAARDFINEVNNMVALARKLQSQVQMIESYAAAISSAAGSQFNEYYLANILNYITSLGWAIQGLMDDFNFILDELGLTKAERKAEADKTTDRVIKLMDEMSYKLIVDLTFMQDVSELVAFENFVMGRSPETGLDCIGAESTGAVEYEEGSPNQDDGASESEVKQGGKTLKDSIYQIILMIIGFSCVGSLGFALYRYVNGSPGAEQMFVRIFAIVVIVIIMFSIISRMVFGS